MFLILFWNILTRGALGYLSIILSSLRYSFEFLFISTIRFIFRCINFFRVTNFYVSVPNKLFFTGDEFLKLNYNKIKFPFIPPSNIWQSSTIKLTNVPVPPSPLGISQRCQFFTSYSCNSTICNLFCSGIFWFSLMRKKYHNF